MSLLQPLSIASVTVLAFTAGTGAAWASDIEPGQTLEAAIQGLEQQGYRLFYSSDLVRPWMLVGSEPAASDDIGRLNQVLGDHGLMLRRGLNDSWLVVRAPREQRPARQSEPIAPPAALSVAASAPMVEEVIVAASQYEIRRAQTTPAQGFDDFELESLPDLGEDALRAVSRLPGLASSGWSALGNVRGGEIGETLVRLDGLRLYDPFHLKDFKSVFSAIDPRIVESMDIYTGGFPAIYGERMSGVIDVESIPAPQSLYHEIGFSFFNSSFLSSGRFAEAKGEWIASIRRSNLDLLYQGFSDQPERPRYVDVFGKIGFEINDHLKITGNVLRLRDDISLSDDVDREERAFARQLDVYNWLKLDHDIDGATSGSTLVARTTLDNRRAGTTAKDGVSRGALTDTRNFTIDTIRSEWSRVLGARMLLEFGGAVAHSRGQYGYEDSVEFGLLFVTEGAPQERQRSRSIETEVDGRQLGLFASLRFDWNDALTTEFGFRWDRQAIGDRRDTIIGPRLGIRYSLSERSSIRASWGRFFQPQSINELQVNDGVEGFLAPQATDQRVIGFDRLIGDRIALRIEAYEKSMVDLRPRYENLLNTRVLLPELKPDRVRIAPTGARAHGYEIAVDGVSGDVRWWTAYSFARVRDVIDGVEVARSWDQTHALSAGFTWSSAKWNLSSGVIYRTGWPKSTVVLDETAAEPTAMVLGVNATRMRAFGSLDFRASRRIVLNSGELSVSIEAANLTNRANPCCFEYEIGDEEDAGELVLDEVYYLPVVPSLGLLWQF